MIPRRLRLSRAHFASIPGKPGEKRAASPHFSVSVCKSEGNGGSAAVISKKVEKTSVGRHRLKRRVLAVLAPLSSKNQAVIVFARAGSQKLPYSLLKEELFELLSRVMGGSRLN
ncbi:MAG: Ribonuclease protein component [Parcubacteria group bacterium]|nr:Ribonuclease protein component [Parcubacteria group bacterium]